MKRKKQITLIIVLLVSLLLITIVIPFTVSTIVYNKVFNTRFETYKALEYHLDDFEGLVRTEYKFESNDKQKLAAYK